MAGYQREGRGPVVILANGLGGPVAAFRHQLTHFENRFGLLTWDYRGLYGSRGSEPPARVDIEAQADDLEDLMAAAGVEQGILVGWSMGVQVMLELVARRPERATHLILISGTYRNALAHSRLPRAQAWLPGLLDRIRPHHHLGSRMVERLAGSRATARLVRGLHLVSPQLATDELLELAREFKTLDLDVYLRTLQALDAHDASHALSRVTARTLVVGGARDPVFAPSVARDLAARLPGSELYVVPKATHYAPVEFPALVNARIDAFLKRG